VLKRRDEGQFQRLTLLVASLRTGMSVVEAETLVGIRLDPDRLDKRLSNVSPGRRRWPVADRQYTLRASRDRIPADVRGDRVQPGADRALSVEPGQPAPSAQECVLKRVVGIVDRAQHPVAVGMQHCAMSLDDVPERALVAPLCGLEQLVLALRVCRRDSHHQVRRRSCPKVIAFRRKFEVTS
jgi:hypothetical protein